MAEATVGTCDLCNAPVDGAVDVAEWATCTWCVTASTSVCCRPPHTNFPS